MHRGLAHTDPANHSLKAGRIKVGSASVEPGEPPAARAASRQRVRGPVSAPAEVGLRHTMTRHVSAGCHLRDLLHNYLSRQPPKKPTEGCGRAQPAKHWSPGQVHGAGTAGRRGPAHMAEVSGTLARRARAQALSHIDICTHHLWQNWQWVHGYPGRNHTKW